MYGTFIVKGTNSANKTVYLKDFMPDVHDPSQCQQTWTQNKNEAKTFESDTSSNSVGLLCMTYSDGDIIAVESEQISEELPASLLKQFS